MQNITNLLICPDFINAHKQQPQNFTRQPRLTFKNLCLFLLNQPSSALQTELDQFFQFLDQAPFERHVLSAQAFSQARRKVLPSAFEALNQALQSQLDAHGLRRTWQGLRLLAVDGSTLNLPLEPEIERFFGTHQGQPMARLSALHDVLDGQTLHSLMVPLCVDERGCAALHLEQAPADSLLLFDRGYPAQWLFSLLQQHQQHCLIRLPRTYNTEVRDFVQGAERERDITLRASHWAARNACREAGVDPDGEVSLRLIRVLLPGGETEVLATSLMDRERFPADAFAGLYHARWGIETDFRRLKQTQHLENFSGRSVIAVQQDVHAQQLLKNLAQLMLHSQQAVIDREHRHRQHRWKANFAQGLSRLKNTLVTLVVQPCAQGMARLLALMRQSLSAVRPGRRSPHKRRRPGTRGCEGYKPTR